MSETLRERKRLQKLALRESSRVPCRICGSPRNHARHNNTKNDSGLCAACWRNGRGVVIDEPKLIPLRSRDGSARGFAIVDESDFEFVSRWSWYLASNGYAARTGREDERRGVVYLHRVLGAAPDGLDIDHLNGVKVDNRRVNLRCVTHQENLRNIGRGRADGSVRGVFFRRDTGKWVAQTRVGSAGAGGRCTLGSFTTKDEAVRALEAHLRRYDETAHVELAHSDLGGVE